MPQITLPKCNLIDFLLWILRFRKRYRVTGTSMIPLLHPGDHVLVKIQKQGERELSRGDIVVARHPYMRDVQVLKYISEVTADGRFHLRGLNPMESTDSDAFGALLPEDILGRVISKLALFE